MAFPVFELSDSNAFVVLDDDEGSLQVPFPNNIDSGDMLIIFGGVHNGAAFFNTPPGWTLIRQRGGASDPVIHGVFFKIASGSETGNQNFSGGSTATKMARMHRFSGANTVEAADDLLDSSKTVTHPDIVTTGSDRLVIASTGINDDQAAASFDGETGGDLTLAVDDTTTVGFDFGISIQTAELASSGTISGGDWTYSGATEDLVSIGFAIFQSGSTTQKSISVTFTTAMSTATERIRVFSAAISFVTTMAFSREASFFRTINVAFGNAISVVKKTIPVAKAVSFVTSMATTAAKFVPKAISVAFGTAFTLGKTTKLAKAVSFVTAMAFSRTVSFFRSLAVGFTTAFALTKKVSVSKAISFITSMSLATEFIGAFTLFFKSINVAFVTSMSTSTVALFFRALNVAFVTTMTLAKTVKKAMAIVFATAFTLVRKTSVTKAVAFVTAFTRTTTAFFFRALSVSFITTMVADQVLTAFKALSVGFGTSISLAKKVSKTIAVGFVTGFGISKLVRVVKQIPFVTSMARTTVSTRLRTLTVSFITTMVTTPARKVLKSLTVGFVTGMSTATRFISGFVQPTGAILLFFRRRRRNRDRR